MKVYQLRDKDSGLLYKGSGYFSKKGTIYTSKGHIKNSIKQSWNSGYRRMPLKQNLEIVEFEMTEIKTEPYELQDNKG